MKTDTVEEVKERPILFSTPMVKAILEGRKTVTRRIMNPQPSSNVKWQRFGYTAFTPDGHISGRGFFPPAEDERFGEKHFKIPYGNKGDILWVRETWRAENQMMNLNVEFVLLLIIHGCKLIARWSGSFGRSMERKRSRVFSFQKMPHE
jgi:hypothetical protein